MAPSDIRRRLVISTLKHIRAILLLPAMVTVVIPAIILLRTNVVDIGCTLPAQLRSVPSLVGIVLISLGLLLMVKTIALFATIGEGTLAPWEPPQNLVVRGIYRYVRNPMISGVLLVLLGEAILLGSVALFEWFIGFLLINMIYIPFFEESGLERRFGQDYLLYKRNVPRWIPRVKPWNELSGNGTSS